MSPEDVRLFIYRSFKEDGKPPTAALIASRFAVSEQRAMDALVELAAERHIVLDEELAIVMAHPFASVPLGFSVMGPENLWWGGCSWDSFALPHLLASEEPFLVATSCPNCANALAWNVSSLEPPEGDEVAHFLIPTAQIWDDVVHTCSNQRIYCSEACLTHWLQETDNARGYAMDLSTLWTLASAWYKGRLDPGYVRREPSSAKDYFRQVGLKGSFWGLED